jgi:hypothetical protein
MSRSNWRALRYATNNFRLVLRSATAGNALSICPKISVSGMHAEFVRNVGKKARFHLIQIFELLCFHLFQT